MTHIFPFLIRYLLHCQNPAIITFVLSAVSVPTLTFTPQKQLPPPLYTPNLTTVTLWSSEISNKPSPAHPECSCSNCCPGSKIKTRHSYILKSFHWLTVSERIEYKIISLTYKILNTTQPSYLYDLVSIQLPHGHNTRSSPYVTLIKPSSSLKVTHRSFRHASPHLLNQLPTSLRIPHPNYSPPSRRPSFEHAGLTCYTLLSPSITFSLFHSELKTYFFRNSYPPPQSVSVCRTDLISWLYTIHWTYLLIGFMF